MPCAESTRTGFPSCPRNSSTIAASRTRYGGWLAGFVTGSELPAYRAISLLTGAGVLALIFAIVRRLASPQAAILAAGLVAISIPFWAVTTSARFYGPFLFSYLLCILFIERRSWIWLVAAAALCRFTHELAFTLMAIPALMAFFKPSGPHVPKPLSPLFLKPALSLGAGLIAAQVVIFAVHYLAPASGDTMIKRFFLWQVLNLFERPPATQLGIFAAGMVIAWLLAPRRAGLSTVVGLSGATMVLAFAVGRAAQSAPVSRELVTTVLAEATRYPLDMFWNLGHAHPVMLVAALALLLARLLGAGGEWTAGERGMHLAWIGWVLWFGVIESGITINYTLLPVTLMLAAIAVDLVAVVQHAALSWPGVRGSAVLVGATALVLALAADQWRGTGTLPERLAVARPTIDVPGIDVIRNGLHANDRVACTDELACLVLVGRADRWLALDDYVRERFLVKKAGIDVGVYAGSPAAFTPADLFRPGPRGEAPDRVIIVDVFKEYPVGNSRAWLPRALDADALESRTLLETSQVRVVEVWPPIRNARLLP